MWSTFSTPINVCCVLHDEHLTFHNKPLQGMRLLRSATLELSLESSPELVLSWNLSSVFSEALSGALSEAFSWAFSLLSAFSFELFLLSSFSWALSPLIYLFLELSLDQISSKALSKSSLWTFFWIPLWGDPFDPLLRLSLKALSKMFPVNFLFKSPLNWLLPSVNPLFKASS